MLININSYVLVNPDYIVSVQTAPALTFVVNLVNGEEITINADEWEKFAERLKAIGKLPE